MGMLGAIWGIAGVSTLLGWAIYRLTPLALDGLSQDLTWYHWAALVAWVAFMAFGEGYRGFQKAFSPRVAARARYLMHHPRPLHVLLGPVFCMGFIHATRRRKIVSSAVTGGVIFLVLIVRLLPQPWRGIVDLGVVVGLSWGLIALLLFTARALFAEHYDHPPETPDTADRG